MNSKPFFARLPVILTFIVLALLLDQWIKYTVEAVMPFEELQPVLPYFGLFRTWNEGVAFSFLSGVNGWLIVGMRLVIISFIIWWWRSSEHPSRFSHLGFTMVIAGAAGNIVDQFVYGHVVDYFLFYTQTWSFAVFNLADVFITTGAVVIGFCEIFLSGKSRSEKA